MDRNRHTNTLMRKASIAALALLLLLSLTGEFAGVWHVRNPELFGDGRAALFHLGPLAFGYVDAWGDYILFGWGVNKLSGWVVPINRVVVDTHPCPYALELNGTGRQARGWLDFRGHPRKFCAARQFDNLSCE